MRLLSLSTVYQAGGRKKATLTPAPSRASTVPWSSLADPYASRTTLTSTPALARSPSASVKRSAMAPGQRM